MYLPLSVQKKKKKKSIHVPVYFPLASRNTLVPEKETKDDFYAGICQK